MSDSLALVVMVIIIYLFVIGNNHLLCKIRKASSIALDIYISEHEKHRD